MMLKEQVLRAAFEPAERVAANEVGAQGETSPFKIVIISKLCYEKFFF